MGITLRGITHAYTEAHTGRRVPAVANVDLDVASGELLALLGPSGCGKSTLLRMIAGMLGPDRGEVLADGRPVREVGPERVLVFQDGHLFPWLTVRENVAFGPRALGRALDGVDALLERLGLADARDRFPKELSGGMRQRAALARALAVRPRVLLLDEPFGALDALSRETLQGELETLWLRERVTMVLVTHSVDEALRLADRVVVLSPRPARVRGVYPVDAPRPRDPEGTVALRREIAALLREP
jgi:ABC-type nitrate/sulfonate/bicarbonate transport system ATPase subunit